MGSAEWIREEMKRSKWVLFSNKLHWQKGDFAKLY